MNGTGSRNGMGWGARLLVALVLILIGAAAAVWSLAHYQPAARFLGIASPASQPVMLTPKPVVMNPPPAAPQAAAALAENARIAARGGPVLRARGVIGGTVRGLDLDVHPGGSEILRQIS